MCGEVNAKNRMGGYVGFMPFGAFADTGRATILSGDRTSPANVAAEATIIAICPAWAPMATPEARDFAASAAAKG